MISALTLTGSLLCTVALAQTRVCLGGDLDHLTQAQKATCSAKLAKVRSIASSLRAPRDWHFVVVCGEEGWKQYAAYSSGENGALQNASVDTNYEGRETFLRESSLSATDLALPENLVTREISSILLHGTDRALSLQPTP